MKRCKKLKISLVIITISRIIYLVKAYLDNTNALVISDEDHFNTFIIGLRIVITNDHLLI
jgi:hypothetical protein